MSKSINNNSIIPINASALKIYSDTLVQDSAPASSLFQNHLLIVKGDKSKNHITNYDFGISAVLLFLFILFVWIYVTNHKKLIQIINGFYNNRNSNQMSRNELSIGNRASVFFSIFFVITLTLFINKLISFYGFHLFTQNVTVLHFLTAFFIISAYSIKFASIKIAGFIFKMEKEAKEYMSIIFLFCNTLGLFMLPIIICLSFVKQFPPGVFIYLGFLVISIFMFIRTFRGIFIGFNSSKISKIYLFMYLCIFEILPFVILVKLFINNIK